MNKSSSLVFLTGLLCDERIWRAVTKELSASFNTSIVAFKGCHSIGQMAEKVMAHIARATLAPCVVVGHSMGGRVALEVYKQAPQIISALGLFNTGVHPVNESEKRIRQKLVDSATSEGLGSLATSWLYPMVNQANHHKQELMTSLVQMLQTYSLEEYLWQIEALLTRPNAQEVLELIDVPTLLLSGKHDTHSPPAQHLQMQKYIKNSQFVNIENAGHMAPVECPNEVAEIISSWILDTQNKDTGCL